MISWTLPYVSTNFVFFNTNPLLIETKQMNTKTLKKSVNIAKRNFDRWSKFSIEEFRLILDHVTNADFVERLWLHKQVPAITYKQMDAIVENQLAIQMEMKRCSTLLYEVMGGKEGTGIDETSYVVGVWGSEELERAN